MMASTTCASVLATLTWPGALVLAVGFLALGAIGVVFFYMILR
jgi:hypothetical protein